MLNILEILIGPLVSLVGIFFGYRLLKNKLIENNVTATLNLIQETNRKTNRSCQKLLDELYILKRDSNRQRKEELLYTYDRLTSIYYEALDGCSEAATYLHLLKTSIQAYLNIYDERKYQIENVSQIYRLIWDTLSEVIFYCTQAVPIPRSASMRRQKLIHKQIVSYVTYPAYTKYRHFNIGVIQDGRSAHHLLFFTYLNNSTTLINIAASTYLDLSRSIFVYLYRQSIYAPLKLDAQGFDDLIENHSKLHLIRIETQTVYGNDIKKMINLTYKNNGPINFVENLTEKYLGENFYDMDFPGEGISLKGYSRYRYEGDEAFTVTIDKEVLVEYHNRLKSKIKRRLKLR